MKKIFILLLFISLMGCRCRTTPEIDTNKYQLPYDYNIEIKRED